MHEIGVKRLHILIADDRVRGIRHGGIEGIAIFRHAMTHRFLEVVVAVLTNTGRAIGSDVGGVDGANRGGHRQTTGKGRAAFAGVTGHTVTGARQILSPLNQIVLALIRQRGKGQGAQNQGQNAIFHRHVPYACTSGPGFFR